jgi:hypothetical protein
MRVVRLGNFYWAVILRESTKAGGIEIRPILSLGQEHQKPSRDHVLKYA